MPYYFNFKTRREAVDTFEGASPPANTPGPWGSEARRGAGFKKRVWAIKQRLKLAEQYKQLEGMMQVLPAHPLACLHTRVRNSPPLPFCLSDISTVLLCFGPAYVPALFLPHQNDQEESRGRV